MIELQGIIRIIVVHHGHCIPFHLPFVEKPDAFQYLLEGRLAGLCPAVFIVKILWPVDGDAHKPAVVVQELAPFVSEQGTVGLEYIFNPAAIGVFLLQLQGMLVKTQGAHQGFPAMPGEQDLVQSLRLDVFLREELQRFIGHLLYGCLLIKIALFQIVAIRACQVAVAACGLQHDIKRL